MEMNTIIVVSTSPTTPWIKASSKVNVEECDKRDKGKNFLMNWKLDFKGVKHSVICQ